VKKRPLVIGDEFGWEREEVGIAGGHTSLVLLVVRSATVEYH
jgi:hypothetical protein